MAIEQPAYPRLINILVDNNISLKWKHIFNNSLYAVVTAGYDKYNYNITSKSVAINAYKLGFDVNQENFKAHFNYFASSKHTVEFGMDNILYKLHPGTYEPQGKSSLVVPDIMQKEQGLESALFISDKYTVTSAFSVEGGIRYSMFNVLGPDSFNVYPSGVPKTVDNIVGTNYYGKNKFIKTYQGPEIRL